MTSAMEPKLSLYKSRTRCFALDDSDYLIVEPANTSRTLSADTARQMQEVGTRGPAHSVLLWNSDNQISGLIDLDQTREVPIKDFTPIRAVGIAPDLGHRLGKWKRQHRSASGLWSVEFQAPNAHADPISRIFEEHILHPWIGPDLVVHGSAHVIIEAKRFDRNSLREGIRQAREYADADWLFAHYVVFPKDVDYFIVYPARSEKSASLRNRLEGLLKTTRLKDVAIRSSEEIKDVQTAAAQRKARSARSDDPLLEVLKTTGRELRAAGHKLPPAALTPASDPVQNAIEIRQQLLREVPFIDAATWAKWRRGTASKNPSAALGKYKRQNRVFAVRAGNRDLYPRFQFSENAEPLPVIADILKLLSKDAQGWPLLSWFEAENANLKNRKPSAVVASAPSKVLEAARYFYARDD